jgi:hypothetical protein
LKIVYWQLIKTNKFLGSEKIRLDFGPIDLHRYIVQRQTLGVLFGLAFIR